MKKLHKLILSFLLAIPVIASFRISYALYSNQNDLDPITISIGTFQTFTNSDNYINYLIDTSSIKKQKYSGSSWVSWDDGEKISSTINKIKYIVPLSFEYKSDGSYSGSKQPYALGRLQVKLSLINENLPAGTTASAKLTGYSGSNYFSAYKVSNFLSTTSFASGSQSTTGSIDMAVDDKSTIKCEIELDFSKSVTYSASYQASSLYNINVIWGKIYSDDSNTTIYSDFDPILEPTAYIRGDANNWSDNENYRLVPNIYTTNNSAGTDKVEWMYLKLTGFTEMKVYDESATESDKWIGCRGTSATDASGSDGSNAILTSTSYYDIYYVRNATYEKGFWVSASST